MPTITTRLTGWYVGASGIILIIVSFSLYSIFEARSRDSLDSDLRSYSELLVSGLEEEPSDISEVFDKLVEMNKKPQARFSHSRFLVASKDSVVFDPDVVSNLDSLIANLSDEEKAPQAGRGFRTIDVNDVEYRTFTKRIRDAGGNYVDIVAIASLDKLYATLAQLRYLFFIIIPVSLIAAGVGGWIIARRFLAPVREITSTAAAISSENLDQRVPVGKSRDELAVLAGTFNDMISRLDATFRGQRQFIADASHDFRTPLTVIQMELELLLMRSEGDSKVHETVERCLIEVERLSRLASDLLLLARADANQLTLDRTVFRFDELVVECVTQLKGLAATRSITVPITLESAVEVDGDESLLRRAIINILHNALKFSPAESVVTVAVAVQDGSVVLTIRDSGMGICPEEIPHMFDRFRRAEIARTTKGTGLGLAIAKAVMDAHEGNIVMTSQQNVGTTFVLTLPMKS